MEFSRAIFSGYVFQINVGHCAGFSVPVGQWHNTECLESGTVFIECKDGAYEPLGPEDILETHQ